MLAVVIAEGVAVVLLGVLVLGLLRSHALILKALHELGAGLELEKEAGTGVTRATTGGKPGPVPVELENGVVPPTINYRTPDPECDLDYTPNEAKECQLTWAISTNLGFGGHNAALALRAAGRE